MAFSDRHGFKELALKDIRLYRNKIQEFLDSIYSTAENAVDDFTSNRDHPDFLLNMDKMNSVIKDCRNQLVTVSNSVPVGHVTPLSIGNQLLASNNVILQVPLKSVDFNVPYLVKILLPGTPTRFWLQLEETLTDKLETELREAYAGAPKLRKVPDLGTFVVCLHSAKYCRGKVVTKVEYASDFPKFDVILVDYGETVTTSIDFLYDIQPKFCTEPAHGLLCSLADLEPKNETWEFNVVGFFLNECQSISAIFHPPPPEGQHHTETFSKYLPDYHVSLYKRDGADRLDIAQILVEKGMGKFAKDTTTRSKSTGGDGPTQRSHGSHPVPSDALPPSSYSTESTSLPQLSAMRISNQSEVSSNPRRDNGATKSLNAEAAEFKYTGRFSAMATSTSSWNTQADRKTDASSSAITGRAAGNDAKVRCIPFHFENGRCTSGVEDVVDLLLRPPSSGAEKSPTVQETMFKEVDTQLMEQFLDSLSSSDPSPVCHPDNQTLPERSSSPKRHPHLPKGRMDYQYGATLKARPLPFSADNTDSQKAIGISLTHVVSPSHFYVHLVDEIESLVEPLNGRLAALYRHSQPVPVSRPEIGSFWVVQESGTEFWYRVRILSLDDCQNGSAPTICHVFLVDWGGVDTVPICQLRPLVKELLDIPCLALRCRLDGIYPYRLNMNSKNWSEEATRQFIHLTGANETMTALVSAREPDEDGAVRMVVLRNGDDEDYTVNEVMVRLRLASSRVFTIPSDCEDDGDSDFDATDTWDPMSIDYYSPNNNVALNTENYDSVTTGYIPKDEERICRFFRASGTCYKGIRCDHLHLADRSNTLTNDRMEVFVDLPSMASLVPGSLVSVQVTCVTNSCRFYAILPHGPIDLQTAFPSAVDDTETLESLQAALQAEYGNNYHQHRTAIIPTTGDIVIARSPEDDQWYRGRIVKEAKNDIFGVFFVDFGNAQLVHLRDICNPLPRFVHLPAQAVEMFLNGIDTDPRWDTDEARDAFGRLVQNRDLVAKIVHQVPFVCVDLYDTSGPDHDDIDIAGQLVRMKVAKPVQKKQHCRQHLALGQCIPG